MTIGLKLGHIIGEIGGVGFLHSFFSTISSKLEPDGWGSKYPIMLNTRHQGSLEQADAKSVLIELNLIVID